MTSSKLRRIDAHKSGTVETSPPATACNLVRPPLAPLLHRHTPMSSLSSPHNDFEDIWLTVADLPSEIAFIAQRVASFPALRGLVITPFRDERSGRVLLRLRFRDDAGCASRLRAWATVAGFDVFVARDLDGRRRAQFFASVASYRLTRPNVESNLDVMTIGLAERLRQACRAALEVQRVAARARVAAMAAL